MKPLFITWMPHCRRSDALAAAFGGHSYLVHNLQFKRPFYAPIKYLLQTVRTVRILLREQPDLVLVASPPVTAILPVWLIARASRIPFVVDAHTGIFDGSRWRWSLPLTRFLSRQAALTIVTNSHLAEQVARWGATVMVIGDVPLDFPVATKVTLGEAFHIVVVNSFSDDEPLEEILRAAPKVPMVSLHVTGDLRYASAAVLRQAPTNVRFTGWLSDDNYVALLRAADAVMVLTTRDHTMQRGAYEAMALAKPLITSDWPLLRETFKQGTLHVSNRAEDIERALLCVQKETARLSQEMAALKLERGRNFSLKQRDFWRILDPLLSGSHNSPQRFHES